MGGVGGCWECALLQPAPLGRGFAGEARLRFRSHPAGLGGERRLGGEVRAAVCNGRRPHPQPAARLRPVPARRVAERRWRCPGHGPDGAGG
eukprot:13226267-Alexandrium_andersonii.AAC.1